MFQDLLEKVQNIPVLYQWLAVFLIAFVPFLEGYVAVPVGLLAGLPFLPTLLLALLSNWISVLIVIKLSGFFSEKLLRRRKDGFLHNKMQRAKAYFNKYGIPGIALIGPITVSNHIGAAVSIASGGSIRKVKIWQAISIILWTTGAGILVSQGIDLLK